ncbi:ogr/Delta-like zinc finger family protein [Chromobacterium haemolyticum]|nr:ogr/Delta-like zinc finger family protein [Chromobacterium haemolyticum]
MRRGVAGAHQPHAQRRATKEIYYNCSNDDCCHQYKTLEGEPLTLAQPIHGGARISAGAAAPLAGPVALASASADRDARPPASPRPGLSAMARQPAGHAFPLKLNLNRVD